jgi:hypothetical protein
MVRAQARGVIRFQDADPQDPMWRLHVQLLIGEAERDDEIQLLRDDMVRLSSLIGLLSEAPARAKLADQVYGILQKIRSRYFPWLQDTGANTLKEVMNVMADAWVRQYGDPSDPAVQARIAATEAWLEKNDLAQGSAK